MIQLDCMIKSPWRATRNTNHKESSLPSLPPSLPTRQRRAPHSKPDSRNGWILRWKTGNFRHISSISSPTSPSGNRSQWHKTMRWSNVQHNTTGYSKSDSNWCRQCSTACLHWQYASWKSRIRSTLLSSWRRHLAYAFYSWLVIPNANYWIPHKLRGRERTQNSGWD